MNDVELCLDSVNICFNVVFWVTFIMEIRANEIIVEGITYLISLCCYVEK